MLPGAWRFHGASGNAQRHRTGFGGEVKVTVTVEDGVITDCVIEGDQETAGIGSQAIEQMPEKIVAANGVDVDGVAGATITSEAVLTALSNALNGEAASQEWLYARDLYGGDLWPECAHDRGGNRG